MFNVVSDAESDRYITVQKIVKRLTDSHATTKNYYKCFEIVRELDIWVPHELKERMITTCL